ncbi:MAG: hypothetical protein R3F36_05045 [Candidatus Competibacteraceae bacterium]
MLHGQRGDDPGRRAYAELLDAIPAAEAMRALKECGETQVYVSQPVIEV